MGRCRAHVKGKVEEVGQRQGRQAKHAEQHGKGSQPWPLELRQVKGGVADEDACKRNQQLGGAPVHAEERTTRPHGEQQQG